ncbi:NAD-dependent dehydratase [Chryseobacterium artocarpi]|uniref:NAD-dependent dehydratase n=1 Tax=Chryseobacterium artocarpi TaxID=1414727 RepID=A0A1B8ZZT7_9FLAO|nr:NAD(P)H-binding protein [Chryseobacterium artocarpi]OCA77090.1 NAD-dependent dehydratase [Chryseobacterium artocarpi]
MKKKIIIIGANGRISRHLIDFLKENETYQLTLFSRHTKEVAEQAPDANIIQGDALDSEQLDRAIKGQDIVFVNVDGPMNKFADLIVTSMNKNNVKRLIFTTSLGIYKEIPGKFGEWNEAIIGQDLVRYREAADIIEASDLDYTVVRPSWLTDNDEMDFETTQKGESFIGTEVSRKAVAAYIRDIIESGKDVKASVGVNKPGVYDDKPSFIDFNI